MWPAVSPDNGLRLLLVWSYEKLCNMDIKGNIMDGNIMV